MLYVNFMEMKINVIVVLFFCLLTACGSDKSNNIVSNFEKKNPKFWVKEYPDQSIDISTSLVYFDNNLYWLDVSQESQLFRLHLDSLKVIDCKVKKGRGEGEFGSLNSLKQFKNSLQFLDCNRKKIFTGKKNQYKLHCQFSNVKEAVMEASLLNESKEIVYGIYSDSRFRLISNDSIISVYDKFPPSINKLNLSYELKNMGCLSQITSYENKFVNIIYDSGIIEFFYLNKDQIELVKLFEFNEFKFKPVHMEGYSYVEQDRFNTGFLDICSTKSKVYALFSSVSYDENPDLSILGDWLLTFDWNGKPLRAYSLKYPINRFALDKDNEKIYGFFVDGNQQKLVEYQL